MTIVVDASAITAILFEEPAAAAVRAQVGGQQPIAPELIAYEVANACLVRERRDPAHRESARPTFAAFLEWDILTMRVDQLEVVTLAASTGLTAYDASYLWLARHLNAHLVTLDRRLSQAASAIP